MSHYLLIVTVVVRATNAHTYQPGLAAVPQREISIYCAEVVPCTSCLKVSATISSSDGIKVRVQANAEAPRVISTTMGYKHGRHLFEAYCARPRMGVPYFMCDPALSPSTHMHFSPHSPRAYPIVSSENNACTYAHSSCSGLNTKKSKYYFESQGESVDLFSSSSCLEIQGGWVDIHRNSFSTRDIVCSEVVMGRRGKFAT